MAIKAHTKKFFATLGKKKNLKFNLKEREKNYLRVGVGWMSPSATSSPEVKVHNNPNRRIKILGCTRMVDFMFTNTIRPYLLVGKRGL